MTYRIICDGTNRQDWLGARNVGVGASEVPILFGCGYGDSSELDLYYRKTAKEPEPIEETEGMLWGKRLEPAILEELATRAGLVSWSPNAALLGNNGYPFLVCTPDGITADGEPMEVKNICTRIDEDEWAGTVPEKFYLQLQSQIAVCEAKRGLFGALLFGGRLAWDWIARDDTVIADIDRRTREFWRCVTEEDPPCSNGTSAARKAAFQLAEDMKATELFASEVGDLLLEWEKLKAQESSAKAAHDRVTAQRRALEDSLVLRMGSAGEAFTVTGWALRKTRTVKRAHTVAESVTNGIKITPPRADKRVA